MKTVIIVVIGLALLELALFASNGCACVTLVDGVRPHLQDELRRALSAEHAFSTQHGRFARRPPELAFAPDSMITLQVVPESDSSVTITATWIPAPEIACTLDVTPDTRGLGAVRCHPR